jgi:hypothetical protein
VVGLDTWNAHVTGKRLSRNHNGHGFFEAQEPKKHLGAVNIPHDDRAVVEMFYHAATLPYVPGAIIPRVLKAFRSDLIGPATAPRSTTSSFSSKDSLSGIDLDESTGQQLQS